MSQRDKVRTAREIARAALGDKARLDQPTNANKHVPATVPLRVKPRKSEAVYGLTIGEVASCLGISRTEVERMISAGKMRTLETGFTVMVPVSEVEKLC